MPSVTIRAATDAALTTLLAANGLTQPGEGIGLKPGVSYSHIGQASLMADPPVALVGRFGLLNIDAARFGEAATSTALIALEPHRWAGAPLRQFLGVPLFDPANQVPFAVTARQAKRALLDAGWVGATDEAVQTNMLALFSAFPEPQRSQAIIDWRESQEFQRSNPLIAAMGPVLRKTPAQIDALFVEAARL